MTEPKSPWLKTPDAEQRAGIGRKVLYREVKAKRLRAARIGGRRELRFLAEWIDEWLAATAEDVVPAAPRRVQSSR